MHILGKPRFCQIETGLNRINDFIARQGSDKVTIILAQLYVGSVLISIYGYRLPLVV